MLKYFSKTTLVKSLNYLQTQLQAQFTGCESALNSLVELPKIISEGVVDMAILSPSRKLNLFLNQKTFAQKELISLQQNILWKIDNGAVRTVTYTQSGTPIVLGYWGANDVVGQPLSKIMPYRIECLTSVKVTMLPQQMWIQAIDSLILHIQQADEFFNLTSKKPVSSRLWHLLVWLGQKFGRDVDAGRLIDLRLTQQELSEVAGCARITVTHLMQEFEQEGKLQRHKKRLILLT